jgi:hypothetical protein
MLVGRPRVTYYVCGDHRYTNHDATNNDNNNARVIMAHAYTYIYYYY